MHHFRYITVSNGTSGLLLDSIEGPGSTRLRLLWCHAGSSSILRAGHLAGTHFDEALARSDIAGLRYEIHFELATSAEKFAPAWVPRLLPRVPDFRSKYGQLTRATVLGVRLENLPLAYSWYTVRNLEEARWLLVSAREFSDSDLRLELTAVQIGEAWLGAVVFRYQGVTQRLNGLSRRVEIVDAGRTVQGKRRFAARASAGDLELMLEAEAPLGDFVLLEDHGATRIQTTLFGDCEVRLRASSAATPVTHRATRSCLLELKS
ncbi:MAG TPA: hypothetical protein VI197_35295 [Polyangiaceae bacterium]